MTHSVVHKLLISNFEFAAFDIYYNNITGNLMMQHRTIK